jgi:PKD repeat protein
MVPSHKSAPQILQAAFRLISKIAFLLLALTAVNSSPSAAQSCSGLGSPDFSSVIYVAVTGTSTAAGTAASPVDLLTGIGMVGGNFDKVYVRAGTYVLTAPLIIPSNVDIIGGFNAQWVKDNSAVTTFFRDATNPQMAPPRLVAVDCSGRTNFRLQDLTIRTANATGQGVSTYAVYLNNCSNYDLVRCRIIAGNGGNGQPGAPGLPGLNGAPGTPGQPGYENWGGGNNLPGVGGSGTFPGSNAGGAGGKGGDRGTYNPAAAFPGEPGLNGIGTAGGAGGPGGQGNEVDILPAFGCSANPATNNGTPGEDGGDGTPGFPGVQGVFNFTGGFFVPGNGTPGTLGNNGSGGGGGGGGGSLGGVFWWAPPPIPFIPLPDTIPPNTNGTGAGGSGGGEGGQGGTGGTGGQGAGGSFAVFTWNNGNNGRMKDCILQAGFAGIAGSGGVGGNGGLGGVGAPGINWNQNCHIGAGAPGGNGGSGGSGGTGGAGSQGVTEEFYEHQGGVPVIQQNIYGLSQPVVNVEFSGCTNAPVTFSTNATGTIQWFFGSGSTPNTIHGQTATASFSTPGFKTFTLLVNGIAFTYTDFVDIHAVVPSLTPTIQHGSLQLCAGDVAQFSSSESADNYIWQLSTTQDTVTYAGPNFFNLQNIMFDTAGTYQLTLFTETQCCGRSFVDTIELTVDPIILPAISILSDFADSTNTVCELNEVTFTAATQNPGPTPTYQWQINGVAAGSNSAVFTTSALQDGDEVTAVLTSSLGCATGETALSNGITVNVVEPLIITCSADSFQSGLPTFFEAQVVSGGLAPYSYLWSFGDGTLGIGETVAHIYQNMGNYTATLTVKDSLGCSTTCQTSMIISPTLSANFSVDGVIGCSPFEVNFNNLSQNGVTYYWNFGDGNGSYEFSPQHTYNAAGTYNVMMWAYSGTGLDSASVSNQVVVYPTPVANFQMYVLNPTTGSDSVQFADNSLFADSWLWNFGDPASGANNTSTIQNPLHVFTTNSTYEITLTVSNIYGCSKTIRNSTSVNVGLDESLHGLIGRVYPNPTADQLNVEFALDVAETLTLSVVDMTGRIVVRQVHNGMMGDNRLSISMDGLAEGPYLLRLAGNGTLASRSFIVSRQ